MPKDSEILKVFVLQVSQDNLDNLDNLANQASKALQERAIQAAIQDHQVKQANQVTKARHEKATQAQAAIQVAIKAHQVNQATWDHQVSQVIKTETDISIKVQIDQQDKWKTKAMGSQVMDSQAMDNQVMDQVPIDIQIREMSIMLEVRNQELEKGIFIQVDIINLVVLGDSKILKWYQVAMVKDKPNPKEVIRMKNNQA